MTNTFTAPKDFVVFNGDLNKEWLKKFEICPMLAVDTEAMGLIHGRDRLCLVQICDPDDNVACVRIKFGQSSAPHLKAIFENKAIEKIFHFARFDVAALSAGLDINVKTIFCTKIASKLGRTYTPRHGLKDLVMELVGIELDKHAQSSDWGRIDELSEKQLAYAANDTRYLIEARKSLELMLKREERWELAKRCFNCIPVFSELDKLRFTNTFEH